MNFTGRVQTPTAVGQVLLLYLSSDTQCGSVAPSVTGVQLPLNWFELKRPSYD